MSVAIIIALYVACFFIGWYSADMIEDLINRMRSKR